MDRQHRTRLVGHGSHLAQERHEVRAQRLGRDILVTVQLPLELLQRETLLRAGQARDHVAGDQLFFRGVHPPEAGLGSGALGLGIVLLRAGTLQDEEIEGHERRTLEAQGARPVGQLVGEVRARPVQHGHKVVGNYFNAAFGQIADRLFVILDIALEIARAGLDMLVDGDALHDRPAKARVGDRLSAFFDLPDGPHLAVGNVMEGGHDVGGPGLTDVLKAYGVVRTVPAPGLFAKIHGCIVFRFSNFSHTVLSPLQAPHSFAVYDWCCLPPFRLAANRGMRPGGYATFWWQKYNKSPKPANKRSGIDNQAVFRFGSPCRSFRMGSRRHRRTRVRFPKHYLVRECFSFPKTVIYRLLHFHSS